jgi:hypothetical protein
MASAFNITLREGKGKAGLFSNSQEGEVALTIASERTIEFERGAWSGENGRSLAVLNQ